MNDEVKYPVIRPEGFSEEEWQELEDMWKQMETNVKASISNGEPLVALERITEDWGDLTGEPDEEADY